jgi:hypothetical protein
MDSSSGLPPVSASKVADDDDSEVEANELIRGVMPTPLPPRPSNTPGFFSKRVAGKGVDRTPSARGTPLVRVPPSTSSSQAPSPATPSASLDDIPQRYASFIPPPAEALSVSYDGSLPSPKSNSAPMLRATAPAIPGQFGVGGDSSSEGSL